MEAVWQYCNVKIRPGGCWKCRDNCAKLPDMGSSSVPIEPINQYALVTYLPDELGQFLDQMRRDLVPMCTARSHISLLPPRSLQTDPIYAENLIEELSLHQQPCVIRLGDVSVFPMTSVIYLEIETGQHEVTQIHESLNQGALQFPEPYPFHPHITLAQNFDIGTTMERFEHAKKVWSEFCGRREFLLDRVVFVQNSASNCWRDLRTFELRGMPLEPAPVRTSPVSRTF